jgi:hypothetical protein
MRGHWRVWILLAGAVLLNRLTRVLKVDIRIIRLGDWRHAPLLLGRIG